MPQPKNSGYRSTKLCRYCGDEYLAHERRCKATTFANGQVQRCLLDEGDAHAVHVYRNPVLRSQRIANPSSSWSLARVETMQ
jgi:hypothetical protein